MAARRQPFVDEEWAWAIGFTLAAILVLGWDGPRGWQVRAREASALVPSILAVLAGSAAAARFGVLVWRRERRDAWTGGVGALLAVFLTGVGVGSSAFFLACALQGSLGSRTPGFELPVDLLVGGLFIGAFMIPVSLLLSIARAAARHPAGRAHFLPALAWFTGAASAYGLGLDFLID